MSDDRPRSHEKTEQRSTHPEAMCSSTIDDPTLGPEPCLVNREGYCLRCGRAVKAGREVRVRLVLLAARAVVEVDAAGQSTSGRMRTLHEQLDLLERDWPDDATSVAALREQHRSVRVLGSIGADDVNEDPEL